MDREVVNTEGLDYEARDSADPWRGGMLTHSERGGGFKV